MAVLAISVAGIPLACGGSTDKSDSTGQSTSTATANRGSTPTTPADSDAPSGESNSTATLEAADGTSVPAVSGEGGKSVWPAEIALPKDFDKALSGWSQADGTMQAGKERYFGWKTKGRELGVSITDQGTERYLTLSYTRLSYTRLS